jgi:conjugative coupling factor TraD (TOL family)
MSLEKPLEGLLRPPLEWYSASASCAVMGLLFFSTQIFFLPPLLMKIAMSLLAIFSFLRFKQGLRIKRYHLNLKRMPTYTMSSQQMPVSAKGLFVGKGFLWQPIHTQRLRDLDLSYNISYRYPSSSYYKARRFESRFEKIFFLKYFAKWLGSDFVLNPFRPYPPIGGEPCLHGVSEKESDIYLDMSDRAGHTVVIGTTGVGKTRLAEMLIAQDIRRAGREVVIVLDPKGDADLLKRIIIEAILAGREEDLIILHLGFPEFSARYNPIGSFTKLTQVATRLANALPSTGNAAAFKDFAWRYVNLVTKGLLALGVKPTYKLISFYITKMDQLFFRYSHEVLMKDINVQKWITNFIEKNTRPGKTDDIVKPTREKAIFAYVKEYINERNLQDIHQLSNDLLTDLFAACQLDKTYYDKITASIGPLLEKLTSGEMADLLSPDYNNLNDKRPIFDWLQVIRQRKIVYVGMDAMTDKEVSATVGNAMLSDLVSVAGHLYNFGIDHGFTEISPEKNLPNVRIHSDEFNEIIGYEFIPILNKSRGAGFNVTAYTQTWSDVEARLDSKAKAGQVAGNFNSMIMLRTKEAATIEMLLAQLPKIPITRVLSASSSSDSPGAKEGTYYQSSNEDRFSQIDVRLIEQSDVANLPKGQAWCSFGGNKLFKIRIPLPKIENIKLPLKMGDLIQNMRIRATQ